jgi:flagellar biogenesis protein FliO
MVTTNQVYKFVAVFGTMGFIVAFILFLAFVFSKIDTFIQNMII